MSLAPSTSTPVPTVAVTFTPTSVPSATSTVVVANLGGHDWFDVLSALVVPGLLGLVTVLVSVVSLRIAQLALKTASDANELERLRRQEELRRRRYGQVPAFQEWFVARVRDGRTNMNSLEAQRAQNVEAKLIRDLYAASENDATVLVEMLSTDVETQQQAGMEVDQILSRGLYTINEWVRDPEMVGPISWPHCL